VKGRKLKEFELIRELTRLINIKDKNVIVGFGDDCSAVKLDKNILLFSNDIQVENIHFIADKISPRDLGWKLISVNVSDIVACGGLPKWCNISLGISEKIELSYIKKVYKGISEALEFYNFDLIGGNTSKAKELILDLFIVGTTERFISRHTAKLGDMIYISGYTGLSKAGLELLLMDKKEYEDFEKQLIKYHTRPIARINLVNFIKKYANSCIDISDGLVADLGHMIENNNIGILIENIHIHPLLKKYCYKYKKNPLNYIFYGGEDYELAFSINPEKITKTPKNILKIGKTISEKGIFLKYRNKKKPLKIEGFSHL